MANTAAKKEKMSENKSAAEVCTIAAQTTIKGDISAPGNIRLEGTIDGNVKCSGKLVMAAKAIINGDISCVDLISEGAITGNIDAQNNVALMASSSLTGNITTKSISIEEGGLFNGSCTIR